MEITSVNRKIMCNKKWSLTWFREWIQKTDASFIIEQDTKRDDIFYFKNITHSLEIWIKSNEIIIAAVHRGICWDILKSIELYPCKCEQGYFCSECNDNPPFFYTSLKDLYLKHNCYDILNWYRDNLINSRNLYLLRLPDKSCSWATISINDELNDKGRFIIKKIPLY
jgi:hypothetical protein